MSAEDHTRLDTAERTPVSPHLRAIAQLLREAFKDTDVGLDHVQRLLQQALLTRRFGEDLSELFRATPDEVHRALAQIGLVASTARRTPQRSDPDGALASELGFERDLPQGIRIRTSFPPDDLGDSTWRAVIAREWSSAHRAIVEPDLFLSYYRTEILESLERYQADIAPRIRNFVSRHFGPGGPRHIVTVGIGANEQFWHYPQLWCARQDVRPYWHICDNPKDFAELPETCVASNCLFLEFSRSGKTQETVKFHEYLNPESKVVVFANSGPLSELAKRSGENGLLLPFPESVPGRYGKNLTPLVLAPFDLLGLPIRDYWNTIISCTEAWDLADYDSLPVRLAVFIRVAQLTRGTNQIYLGTNDDMLRASGAELVQFWNEGVCKDGNDILMSPFLGLPRDSHLNVEGVLANSRTKLGFFLHRRAGDEDFLHPLRGDLRPVNSRHRGLSVADVDYALARANEDHFSTRMPTIAIELERPNLEHSAILSQLWADLTYCYAKLLSLNPGSNPEVRLVRDRSESLLEEFARKKEKSGGGTQWH